MMRAMDTGRRSVGLRLSVPPLAALAAPRQTSSAPKGLSMFDGQYRARSPLGRDRILRSRNNSRGIEAGTVATGVLGGYQRNGGHRPHALDETVHLR